MEAMYVGIDVGKRELEVSLWQEELHYLGAVANNESGFTQLAVFVRQHCRPEQQVHLVLEPTGGYELQLVHWAWAQKWDVSLPNPWLVRRWAESQGRRAKTDAVDSRSLALYGVEQRPKATQPLPAHLEELDQLLRRKEDLEKMLRQERNRQMNLGSRPHLPPAVQESMDQVIGALERALEQLDEEIQALLARHASMKTMAQLLLTVPGVGPKTVLPLLVTLARWHTLTDGLGSAKSLTAYVGLDPAPFQSGYTVYKRPSISKKGNRSIRTALFNAARGGTIRGNSPLRQFYCRLIGNNKPPRLASVAAARKILVWAWAVFRDQTPFQPQKALPAHFAS